MIKTSEHAKPIILCGAYDGGGCCCFCCCALPMPSRLDESLGDDPACGMYCGGGLPAPGEEAF